VATGLSACQNGLPVSASRTFTGMTDPLADTWATRDLPVLRAVAAHLDQSPHDVLETNEFEVPGVAPDDVPRALAALNGAYLDVDVTLMSSLAGPGPVAVRGVTERGRRAAGLWPSGESADALIELLNKAADDSDDEEDRTWLRVPRERSGKPAATSSST
jgi:hypothetical protein